MIYTTETGEKVEILDKNKIGEGGEAWIFKLEFEDKRFPKVPLIGKIYKGPDAADYQGDTDQDKLNRAGAKYRLEHFAAKLHDFPTGLPDNIGAPLGVLLKKSKPAGFYSRLVPEPRETLRRYCDAEFRQNGIDTNDVIKMLVHLHETVLKTHAKGLIFGDFNDLNILGPVPYIIDAESGSFGKHMCTTFTQRFVDPTLCDPNQSRLVLMHPHTKESDIYAFNLMVFQSLLFISPYEGKYKPTDKSKWCPQDARPLFRRTVLDPETIYPKWAAKLGFTPDVLPDELMHHFVQVLHEDFRGQFPINVLRGMRWTKCTKCGAEHAKPRCPHCAAPGAVAAVIEIKGTVTSERIFQTAGIILHAEYQNGHLRYLYHDGTGLRRDGGELLLKCDLDPRIRYRLNGDNTCLGKGNTLVTFRHGQPTEKKEIGTYGVLPMFDANVSNRYWVHVGRLLSDKQLGHGMGASERVIGQVLQDQTMFWVGESFGFGFYRASELQEYFVFDADSGLLKDGLAVAPVKGQLLDATCEFSSDKCWFFTSVQFNGNTINRCVVLDKSGNVLGMAEENATADTWLRSLRGKCAVGHSLFSTTDEGIVRIECANGAISLTRSFPDTEPFVDENCRLFPGKDCLHVVTKNEIRKLRIA